MSKEVTIEIENSIGDMVVNVPNEVFDIEWDKVEPYVDSEEYPFKKTIKNVVSYLISNNGTFIAECGCDWCKIVDKGKVCDWFFEDGNIDKPIYYNFYTLDSDKSGRYFVFKYTFKVLQDKCDGLVDMLNKCFKGKIKKK